MSRTLIIPGLCGRGGSWQRWLGSALGEASILRPSRPGIPDLASWTADIACALDTVRTPSWIVARDFGALASLSLLSETSRSVSGVLLVAPGFPGQTEEIPLRNGHTDVPGALVVSAADPDTRLSSTLWLAERFNLRRCQPTSPEPGPDDSGQWPELLALLHALQSAHQLMPRGPVRS